MASSLILPSAESLAGQWTVEEKASSCDIQFSAQPIEQANGYALTISKNCTPLLPELPEAWRPAPDGIALLNRSGQTIVFFSKDGDLYRSPIWGATAKLLKRKIE